VPVRLGYSCCLYRGLGCWTLGCSSGFVRRSLRWLSFVIVHLLRVYLFTFFWLLYDSASDVCVRFVHDYVYYELFAGSTSSTSFAK
jgi:hypothetical protein